MFRQTLSVSNRIENPHSTNEVKGSIFIPQKFISLRPVVHTSFQVKGVFAKDLELTLV